MTTHKPSDLMAASVETTRAVTRGDRPPNQGDYKKPIHALMIEALNRLEVEVIHYRNTGVGYQHLCDAMDEVHAFDNGGTLS